MKIALIGASGKAGARILKELTDRGHTVTAIARHPEAVPSGPRVTPKTGDITDEKGLSKLLAGHDAVISAVRFLSADARTLIQAVKQAGVNRLQVVGGAGSLTTASGVQVVDTPDFPDMHKAEASAGRAFLNVLQQEQELDWVFLSPSALFIPGERTGTYRLGEDHLLVGPDGQSRISMEDYAIAMVDELEKPRHHRRRFTVGY
jgi:putative NADH-flavin reductase